MSEGVFSRRFDYQDRRRLTDEAYNELKRAIIELKFKPGDVLRESAIGRQLGISKTPVREALLKLEHDGLVELIPFRGAQVSGYGADDIREILELRAIVQSARVRRVAGERDEDMIRLLRSNVAAGRPQTWRTYGTSSMLFDEFDAILVSRLDNRRAVSLIGNLQDHMMRIGQLAVGLPGRAAKCIEQQAHIVDALEAGDPDAAGEAMRQHIESVLKDGLFALETNDDVGTSTDTSRARRSGS